MFELYLIKPLYNIFVFLIGIMPNGDVGLAILVLTVLVRILAYPAFTASIKTQMGMQAVQADIEEINKKYKDNAEERGKQTMALFKKHNIKPFSSFIAILVQIPIFIGLYYAFFREGLPHINTSLLYSFVPSPAQVNVDFFGILDLVAKHNIVLTIVVVFLQYLVMHFSLARTPVPKTAVMSDQARAQRMQQRVMLYFLPALIGFASYSLINAAGLYFSIGNLFSLGQEWLIRREKAPKKLPL